MDYYYTKLEKKPIKSKNNLFVSKLYKNKILSEKHKLKKNNFITKIKNLWNQYTRKISKSGYLDKLNITTAQILKEEKIVKILDIGGGYGDNFYKFKRFNQGNLTRIKYFILEKNFYLIKIGMEFYSNQKNLHFTKKIPSVSFSIICIIGTLQYIENFSTLFKNLKFKKKSHIYISRTIFSNSKYNYFSIQRVFSKERVEQKVLIYSLKSFISFLKNYGFELEFIRKNQLLNDKFKELPKNIEINFYDLLFTKFK